MARGRETWGRLTGRSMRSAVVQDGIIAPDFHQDCDGSHVRASGRFPQPLSTGGEETGGQSPRAKFLQPDAQTLGMTPRLIEDPGQLRRERGLSLAKDPG